MIKITVNEKVLVRTPRFPFNASLADCWDELKSLIQENAIDFYRVIQDMSVAELSQADKKVQLTVAKYFNRARFRATPYGGFAAVGLADIGQFSQALVIPQYPTLHAFIDWPGETPELTLAELKQQNLKLFTNTTFYCVAGEIRYLRKEDGEFSISAIVADQSILALLNRCLTPVGYGELYQSFADRFTEPAFDELVSNLTELGLLLSSIHPNIIGRDYYDRIGKAHLADQKHYLIAERKTIFSGLPKHLFCHLPELVSLLQRLLPATEAPELAIFKRNFTRRFEQAEVPIMRALDPEVGIGYGEQEQPANDKPFETLPGGTGKHRQSTTDNLKEQLCREIIQAQRSGSPILLETLPAGAVPKTELPNSIAIGCAVADEMLFLDFAGVASVLSLLGRFALASADIEQYCIGIARAEQVASPDVLLFDVGYTQEGLKGLPLVNL